MNKRIYQDCEFEFELLKGLKIEKLVVCEEIESQNVVTVHLKIENGKWYQYFLDAGMGFFETWNEFDKIENDETYRYLDKTSEFKLQKKRIVSIYCVKDFSNSKIIIEFEKEEKLTLRCKEPKLFDSDCELVKI